MIILETNSLAFGEIHLLIFLPRLIWEDQQLFGICTGANFPKCWYISWAWAQNFLHERIISARQLVTVTVNGLSCCDDSYQCNVSTSVHLALTFSKQFCCTFSFFHRVLLISAGAGARRRSGGHQTGAVESHWLCDPRGAWVMTSVVLVDTGGTVVEYVTAEEDPQQVSWARTAQLRQHSAHRSPTWRGSNP